MFPLQHLLWGAGGMPSKPTVSPLFPTRCLVHTALCGAWRHLACEGAALPPPLLLWVPPLWLPPQVPSRLSPGDSPLCQLIKDPSDGGCPKYPASHQQSLPSTSVLKPLSPHGQGLPPASPSLTPPSFLFWDVTALLWRSPLPQYLLAMVIAYFSQAGLPSWQYQRIHFFIAL